MPFAATWMDPESITLSEVNQTVKDKYHGIPLICESLKNDKIILFPEINSQTQKINLWVPKGKERGGINWEFGINMHTLIYRYIQIIYIIEKQPGPYIAQGTIFNIL